MSAYYNEIDPFAAATMRELIREGVIAPGEVDERDIRDVRPDELSGFTQCHFFAGGGVWSYALRRAGWRDEWPIWTGSCPCQPFSTAGKGLGFADERHLWPTWDWLIDQCEPECIAGEQVADAGADAWLDLVQADLEGMGYAFGCVPLASAGFGAPNPRHRSFWMAHTNRRRCREAGIGIPSTGDVRAFGDGAAIRLADPAGGGLKRFGGCGQDGIAQCRDAGRVGDASGQPRQWHAGGNGRSQAAIYGPRLAVDGPVRDRLEPSSDVIGLADALRAGWSERRTFAGNGSPARSGGASDGNPRPTNGYWRDVDWLYCRDHGGPRWRPVDAGTFPLAPRTAGGVAALRLSGNAINAEVATGFIEAMMDVLSESLAP